MTTRPGAMRTAARAMFHVKHRAALTAAALVIALLASGCTGVIGSAHGWAPPVAGPGGLLIVQSGAGTVAAVNGSGSPVAQYTVEPAPVRGMLGRTSADQPTPFYAAPVVEGNTLYLVTYKGRAVRLELKDNAFAAAWTVDLPPHVIATPVLTGNRLYVTAEDGTLHVLDTANGNIVRSSRPTTGRVWGSPAFRDGRLYVGTMDSSELLAVSADSGDIAWRQNGTGATAADVVIEGDTLVVSSFDRTLHALDAATGRERWRAEGDGWFVGRPLVTANAVFAATLRGTVYAFDRSGKPLWQVPHEGFEFRAAPALVGDALVLADRDGAFVGLDAKNGAPRWNRAAEKAKIDANGAVVEGGVFYSTTDHQLLRVDAASGDLKTYAVQPPKSGK